MSLTPDQRPEQIENQYGTARGGTTDDATVCTHDHISRNSLACVENDRRAISSKIDVDDLRVRT